MAKSERKSVSVPVVPILIGAGVVVALLLLYLLVLPSMAVKSYRSDAKPAQRAVQEKLQKVYDSFNADIFTKTDVSQAKATADTAAAISAITSAEQAIKDNEADLTETSSLPLLSIGSYGDARRVATAEQKQLREAKAYLAEYRQVVEYYQKQLPLFEKVEALDKQGDALASTTDINALAAGVDQLATSLQGILDQLKAISPPAPVKTVHDQDVALMTKLIAQFRDLSGGIRALDEAKVTRVANEVTATSNELIAVEQKFAASLQADSTLRKQINALKSQADSLDSKIGKL